MNKKTVSRTLLALLLIGMLTLAFDTQTVRPSGAINSRAALAPDVAVLDAGAVRLRVPDPFLGMFMPVFVAVENQGSSEIGAFEVSAFYDTTLIGTTTVYNLDPGTHDAVYISWDLESLPNGVYTISANASVLPGETNTSDNYFVNGEVLKTIFADVTGDGSVDVFDLFSLGKAYGSTTPPGDLNSDGIVDWTDYYIFQAAHWARPPNPYADLDGDGDVDYDDFLFLLSCFGWTGDPNWNLHADMNADNEIDLSDLLDLSKNYGAAVP